MLDDKVIWYVFLIRIILQINELEFGLVNCLKLSTSDQAILGGEGCKYIAIKTRLFPKSLHEKTTIFKW